MKWPVVFVFVYLVSAVNAFGKIKVGNGDEGGDLEGAEQIESGPLIESREAAGQLLERLSVGSIPALGNLLPEVRRSEIYLAKADVPATLGSDHSLFHKNAAGFVYARTFARPHAATRFFPVALGLDRGRLVALHIHEALHRALPAPQNEDEAIVSELTLSITAPESTRDSVSAAVMANLGTQEGLPLTARSEIDHLPSPNSVGLLTRQFLGDQNAASFPISRMYLVHSYLYPFGGVNSPFGMGLEASVVERPDSITTGPLGISARLRVWTYRGFDFLIFGRVNLNTLSAEELKSSPYGRDVYTVGISMLKETERFYVENSLSLDSDGESRQRIGLVDYKYEYGKTWDAKVRAGVRAGAFRLGGFVEMHLADYFKVSGGAFGLDTGRYRIFSAGPEVQFHGDGILASLQGRFLAGSTKDANYSYLGNLLGPGTAQGSLGVQVAYVF